MYNRLRKRERRSCNNQLRAWPSVRFDRSRACISGPKVYIRMVFNLIKAICHVFIFFLFLFIINFILTSYRRSDNDRT